MRRRPCRRAAAEAAAAVLAVASAGSFWTGGCNVPAPAPVYSAARPPAATPYFVLQDTVRSGRVVDPQQPSTSTPLSSAGRCPASGPAMAPHRDPSIAALTCPVRAATTGSLEAMTPRGDVTRNIRHDVMTSLVTRAYPSLDAHGQPRPRRNAASTTLSAWRCQPSWARPWWSASRHATWHLALEIRPWAGSEDPI
jgi:hypothetical protein